MSKKSQKSDSLRAFLGPRYWPTWLGFGVIWLAAQLPFALQIQIGKGLGWLSYWFARERRHICQTNIALCFPELTVDAQQRLVRDTFVSNGIGVMEVGLIALAQSLDQRSPQRFVVVLALSILESISMTCLMRGVSRP